MHAQAIVLEGLCQPKISSTASWAAKIGPHLLMKFLKLSVVIGTLKAGFSRMAFLLGGWLVGEESDIDLVDMIELTSIPPRRSMGAFRRSLPAGESDDFLGEDGSGMVAIFNLAVIRGRASVGGRDLSNSFFSILVLYS